jgi:Na+-driven multidrug efflux pump
VMKLLTASDIVVLGIFDSVESVAAYSLTKYTPETLVSLVAMVVFGVTPGLGGIIGAGDLEKAARVRAEIMVLTWLIGTALGATVLVWNGVFVPLWVGEGLYAGALPTLLITVMMLQFTFIRNDANIIDLTLELRTKVLLGLVSGVLSLGLAIVLLRVFDLGIVGLCAGFIVGRLILSAAYPLLVGRFLRISLTTQLRSIVRPALVTTLLFGLGLGASRALSPVGWYGFLPLAALTLGITLLTAFYTGLSGEQRTQLWHRFRRVAQRV